MTTLLHFALSSPVGITVLTLPVMVAAYFAYRLFVETVRAGFRAYKFIRSLFPTFGRWFWFSWACLSIGFYSIRNTVADVATFAVQSFFSPVYYSAYMSDSTSATEQAYIKKLRTKVSESQYNQFMAATAQIAAEHQSTVLNFLEVYESECGMNPFALNINEKGDTVAAGPIQFTGAGVSGLYLDAKPVTMRRVKDAVNNKNLPFLLELEALYMRRAAKGTPLKRSCDVYTAVFMPAYVGRPDNTIVACSTCAMPEHYWKNEGLDGYKLHDDKILKSRRYADGKITINDLSLALAYKKAGVVKHFGK